MQEGPQFTAASPEPAAVHSELQGPLPQATCPPLQDERPPHEIAHDAVFGQRICTLPQLLVPVHCSAHEPVSGQRRSRLPHDDKPEHSTRHFIPGGQSMRRAPHEERVLQRIRQASATQPPLQISGHLVGTLVIPLGQPMGASSFGGATSGLLPESVGGGASLPSTEGALSSTGVVSSSASPDVTSALPTSISSSNAPAREEPPHATSSAVSKIKERMA